MQVVFAGAFAARLAGPVKARLSIPCETIVGDEERTILPYLRNADVLVSMGFTKEMAEAAFRLRLIQVPGAGLDRIDRGALQSEIHLANAYGHEVGIAEYIVGAMIALTRSLARLDASLRKGVWDSQWAVGTPPPPFWPELAGKTLGILGFGHIGEALARRAAAFDMRIFVVRRRPETGGIAGVSCVAGPEHLDDVLAQSDYVAVTLPLSDTTHNLLDARRLGLVKQGAVLVNVARAEIIDEAALYHALETRRLSGAALDVWYRYPTTARPELPAHRPFHELDNVIMTPHISGWTEGMIETRAKLIAENIERTARHEPPLNAIS